jgi:DNA mismatch endonuclease (patch repair protein)
VTDVFTPEKRSAVMSCIRGHDTKPELALRSMLHRLGYRFTVRGPNNKALPGKPDLVLPKYRTVIFVHGCFWHGHQHCKHFRLPKSRCEWWQAKIAGNQARDQRNENALRSLGWHVVTIWECALRTAAARTWLALRLPRLLDPPPPAAEPAPLPMAAEDPTPYRTAAPLLVAPAAPCRRGG